jgi:hypothetical protein
MGCCFEFTVALVYVQASRYPDVIQQTTTTIAHSIEGLPERATNAYDFHTLIFTLRMKESRLPTLLSSALLFSLSLFFPLFVGAIGTETESETASTPQSDIRRRPRNSCLTTRHSWFQLLVRWLPLFFITTTCTTTPLSLGLHNKGRGNPSGGGESKPGLGILHNFLDHTLGHYQRNGNSGNCVNLVQTDTSLVHHNNNPACILMDEDTTKNQKSNRNQQDLFHHQLPEPTNGSNSNDNLNNSSSANKDDGTKMKSKMVRLTTGEQLNEEDQKFFDRLHSSLKIVQHWDDDTQLFEQVRSIIPWDDLRNHTGPFSKQDDRLFAQQDALFLQRLCRWFPSFMSWVNAPPCVKCGCKDCEMKTIRPPETEEEKEGNAKRVEGEFMLPNMLLRMSVRF